MNSDQSLTENEIILTDYCSNSNQKVEYFKVHEENCPVQITPSNIVSWNTFQHINSVIKDIFLPKGYPLTVSCDYLEYQVWDTCQAFCSSICGTLTVHAIMEGIGVGSKAATPLSAAITWLMKDGTGMMGSILFAWLKGSKLDSDCKKWRLFADVMNDIAMFLELSIPMVIDYSMHVLCISTAFKALVGTAGSSTRAALITHQAKKGNIADVSAKDGSQELCTNLIAFLVGLILLKNVTDPHQIWTVMCTAAMFHLIFNYKAVRCLKMDVFNAERLRLCLLTYLPTSCVPTVAHVNKREAIFLGLGTSDVYLCGFTIVLGVSVQEAVKVEKITTEELSTIVAVFQSKKYFILAESHKRILNVAFRANCSDSDVLKAYFHAFTLGIAISILMADKSVRVIKRTRKNSPLYRLKNILEGLISPNEKENDNTPKNSLLLKAYIVCEDFIDKEFTAFCNLCVEEGWNIDKHLINVGDWRSEWKYIPEKADVPLRRIIMKKSTSHSSKNEKNYRKSKADYSNLIIS